MAIDPAIHRRVNDRRLYILAAMFIPLIVLLGFARSYYLRGFFSMPPIPSRLVHLHGIVMTAWVVLFVTQVWLVASRRTRVHQRLGVFGAILASLVFVVGMLTALFAAARTPAPSAAPPGIEPLRFLVVPAGDMLVFAILIAAALYFRKRMAIHKRLMLLAAVSLLTPAIARIPIAFIETGGPVVFFGLTDLCIIACVAFDTIKHRRLHPVFLWGTIAIITSQVLRIMLAGTEVWVQFAAWLVGFVK